MYRVRVTCGRLFVRDGRRDRAREVASYVDHADHTILISGALRPEHRRAALERAIEPLPTVRAVAWKRAA